MGYNRYPGKNIDLDTVFILSAEGARDHVPVEYYNILLKGTNTIIGEADFRKKMDDYMYYYGHVGYSIKKEYQGHGYAREAVEIIESIAKNECGYKELIITCNPDNIASYKTLINAGYELIETVDVPKSHELYWKDEKVKCIFKHTL